MSRLRTMHYAWVIALSGALTLFCAIGLGRWAFAVLAPGMQAGMGLSYRQIGLCSTMNFAGYLAAILLVPLLLGRLRARWTTVAGLLLLGGALVALGLCWSYLALLVCFTLAGLGSGLANIPVVSLVAHWFGVDLRGRANGLVIAGNGSGMIFSGFAIPLLNRIFAGDGWRAGWALLGGIVVASAAVVGLLLRNHPAEMGLAPAGRASAPVEALQCVAPRQGGRAFLCLSLLYFAFGATAACYGTFIVSTMLHEYGFAEARAGLLWSVIGFLSIFSGLGFGALSDRVGRRGALVAVFGALAVAYALAGARIGPWAMAASAVVFGAALFATPTLVSAALADFFTARAVAARLSAATLAAAAGQVLGPAAAGVIAGPGGGFTTAYALSAAVAVLAMAVAWALPQRR